MVKETEEETKEKKRISDRILMMWNDKEGDWKFGIEHSLCIDEIMAKLDDPPDESAEWILRRQAIQSILTNSVQKRFRKMKLHFGGIKAKSNTQARYCLAETEEEHYLIYVRYYAQTKNKVLNLVDARALVRLLRRGLSEGRKRKFLDAALKKRLPEF